MVEPTSLSPHHDWTQRELEEFALFCVMVAGKQAGPTARKLDGFLKDADWILGRMPTVLSEYRPRVLVDLLRQGPFERIAFLQSHGLLEGAMACHKIGQCTRVRRAWLGLTSLNLRTVTVEALESVPGIGPKTARFFLLYTRPDVRLAVLDVHVLRFMRDVLGVANVPLSTPTGKRYMELERIWLEACDAAGTSPDIADTIVWNRGAKRAPEEVRI